MHASQENYSIVLKITTSMIKRTKWNLNITLDEARRNDAAVTLSESQVLRWIDELNGVQVPQQQIKELRRRIASIRQQDASTKSRNEIKRLYKEIDALQYKPDYLLLVVERLPDYRRACKGFSVNGVKYTRFVGTNGGVKTKTIVFVSERLAPELRRRMDNGRLLSPAHQEAYILKMLDIPAHTCNGRLLIKLSAKERSAMYWGLQPQLFESFADAYIPHSMIHASQLANYMNAIGVRYNCDSMGPFSHEDISSLLNIVHDTRYNQKGDDTKAYTSRWYAKQKENAENVFKDMLNVLLHAGAGGERREDIAYVMPEEVLDGIDETKIRSVFRGRGFRPAQQYSGNNCSTACVLCYCANPYLPSAAINYLHKNGAELTQDTYALYHLLRWIGRSAIRDCKPITLYIPSRRMRTLLEDWLKQQNPNSWMDEE